MGVFLFKSAIYVSLVMFKYSYCMFMYFYCYVCVVFFHCVFLCVNVCLQLPPGLNHISINKIHQYQ